MFRTQELVMAVSKAIVAEGGLLNDQVLTTNDGTNYREYFSGATMRQFYAAHALQGISGDMAKTHSSTQIAAVAVDMADALIEALRSTPARG